MEATFSLSRHLHPTPFHLSLTRPNKPTFVNTRTNVTFHRNPSSLSLTLRALPTLKSHRKTHIVNCSECPPVNGSDGRPEENQNAIEALKAAINDNPQLDCSSTYREFRKFIGDLIEFPDLKKSARKLRMTKIGDEATELLWEKYCYYCDKNWNPEAYEIGLILAEMYIYQGEYKAAITLCTELKKLLEQEPSPKDSDVAVPVRPFKMKDDRPQLYLAVAYALLALENNEEAYIQWTEFNEAKTGQFQSKKDHMDFRHFEADMRKLKSKIDKMKKLKEKQQIDDINNTMK